MQFAHPLLILAGIICCTAITLLLHLLQKQRHATLQKFAGAQLLGRLTRHVSTRQRRTKHILLLLAVFLLFSALARPQYGFKWVEVKRKGIDILFALDTSKSMLAEDIKPNRLQRARLGIMDFVNQLDGDRVGLMPFAGSGYLMCPLTLDYDAFTSSLSTITTDIIPKGGTNISAVIEEAENVLKNDANHKILILITDGENLQGDAVEAAKKAADQGMTIYTVGVGTPGGELIPIPGNGKSGFIQDEAGKYVTSKLDEKNLTAIAEATTGLYAPLGNSGEGLERIYQQKLQLIPKEELAERRQKVPIERFNWPLTTAIILLVLEFLIPERKSSHKLSIPHIITAGRRIKKQIMPMVLLLLVIAGGASDIHASEAEDAYNQEEYLKASELYSKSLKEHPNDPTLHYNYGAAAYKNNMYDEAIASFSQALKSEDLSLQAKAYYNRGNAQFQKGSEGQQSNPDSALEQWQQAVESYDSALKLNPENSLAAENKKFVEQKIKELQQQKEQQQDKNKDQQDEQQNQDQKKNDENNGDNRDKQKKPENGDNEKSQPQNEPEKEQSDKGDKNEDGKQNSAENKDQQPDKPESSGSDNAEKDTQNETSQPATAQDGQKSEAADQNAKDDTDMQRRELGKMTKEEAQNLLNALKNEEGELNFVPGGQDAPIGRDW
jgi:Ca-activated chloride channel family protein